MENDENSVDNKDFEIHQNTDDISERGFQARGQHQVGYLCVNLSFKLSFKLGFLGLVLCRGRCYK